MRLVAALNLALAFAGIAFAAENYPKIVLIDPPEKDFFSKRLDFHGIPIKSHKVVVDEALYAAYDRLALLFTNLLTKQPMVLSNLILRGAALHIIGREQVTTDLPEWRHDKGKPIAEYNGRTRDQRTRGMGGLLTSCGEENLLKLAKDRYRGRDICLHEFAHNVLNNGCPRDIRALFGAQRTNSLARGRWQRSYAGSNVDEFFAELTMWYFGTHGDLSMTGPKPENGREGLKKYDPEAFALMDDFYSGRIDIGRIEQRRRLAAFDGTDVSRATVSLSPQRGDGRGEGWERGSTLASLESPPLTTPHPQSLSPLRGEGSRTTRRANTNSVESVPPLNSNSATNNKTLR